MECIIKTKQIYLRKICESDIDKGWLTWINDNSLNKFLVSRDSFKREELIKYLNESKPPNVYMFAVCLVENNEYIGNARLSSIDYINKKAAYGRLLGDKNVHGRGIGTEVLILLSFFAFYHLHLNRIETGVVSKNIASIKSNLKAGAIQEGVLREGEFINGVYEDTIRFGVLKSDFENSNKKILVADC